MGHSVSKVGQLPVPAEPVKFPAGAFERPVPGDGTRSHKGVLYDRASGSVLDCLFCRIQGGSEGNALWYRDADVTVFVPRTPAAAIHLLVIPNAHVKNTSTIDASHVPLLERMGVVAMEQLRAHAPFFSTGSPRLPPRSLAPPYPFSRGSSIDKLLAWHATAAAAASVGVEGPSGLASPVPADAEPAAAARLAEQLMPARMAPWEPAGPFDASRALLCFHRAPGNSVDHLHLHALYKPFFSVAESLHFFVGAPWVITLDALMEKARHRAPPAGSAPIFPLFEPATRLSTRGAAGAARAACDAEVADVDEAGTGGAAAVAAAAGVAAGAAATAVGRSVTARPSTPPFEAWRSAVDDHMMRAAAADVIPGGGFEADGELE